MNSWFKLVAAVAFSVSGAAFAQDACESRCNQAQAACLRVCVGKPDSSQPKGQKMTQCLHQCTEETKPCREKCGPTTPPPPRR